MKTVWRAGFAFVLSFMTISISMSQEKIEVKDVNVSISKGSQPGFTVFIKDATLDNVTKKWSQYMKNEKAGDIFKSKEDKVKYELRAGEYWAERAVLREISNKYITTVATIVNTAGGVQLTAFFMLDSAFISKQTLGTTYTDTKNYVRSFAVACYKEAVANELAREEKKLEDLNDKLESLKEKKLSLEKNILRSEGNISELELQLRTNLADQERTGKNLKVLNDSISLLKVNTPEYTVYDNRLKEESKTHKRLLNENSTCRKKIESNKKSILEDQESLKKNQVEQDYQLKLIEDQKAVVNAVKTKLASIS